MNRRTATLLVALGALLVAAPAASASTLAMDGSRLVYTAAAGGYTGASDTKADGEVSFAYFNRATQKWNSKPITIPTP